MDLKKIGLFLKELRREKGITQEQVAEVFGVSGRTVSRWETGTNMPDLSILIQIADYYDVDLKEILNGERKSKDMDKEEKETLLKVADYSEMEKEKAAKAGNTAFVLMFAICTIAIVIQMMLTVNFYLVIGKTAAVVIGGITYIAVMVHHGVWETGSKVKSTPIRDAIISVVCAGIFSVIYALCTWKMGADQSQVVKMALLFFIGITILGYGVLRILAHLSRKNMR